MKFIAYPVKDTEQQHNDHGQTPVGFVGYWMQSVEESPRQDAISHEVQQLVNTGNLGKVDKIPRLAGQEENYHHDGRHGDKTQVELQGPTYSAGSSLDQAKRFRAAGPDQHGRF
jgi:hypothetical protein